MTQSSLIRTLSLTAASVAASAGPSAASVIARTPSISGNGWVAMGILGLFIGAVYLMIAGALHVERRDARLGRRPGSGEHGWFGFAQDDDDGSDHHGNGNGN